MIFISISKNDMLVHHKMFKNSNSIDMGKIEAVKEFGQPTEIQDKGNCIQMKYDEAVVYVTLV